MLAGQDETAAVGGRVAPGTSVTTHEVSPTAVGAPHPASDAAMPVSVPAARTALADRRAPR